MILPLLLLNSTTKTLKNSQNVIKSTQYVPMFMKFYSNKVETSDKDTITIGDVTKNIKLPTNPELVPQKYGEFEEY